MVKADCRMVSRVDINFSIPSRHSSTSVQLPSCYNLPFLLAKKLPSFSFPIVHPMLLLEEMYRFKIYFYKRLFNVAFAFKEENKYFLKKSGNL